MDPTRLCTREVVGIDAQSWLQEAAVLMCSEHVGALVVVTGENPPELVPTRACPVFPRFGTVALE